MVCSISIIMVSELA